MKGIHVTDAKENIEDGAHGIRVPILEKFPRKFRVKAATVGTAAYDYISGKIPIEDLDREPRLLGVTNQVDGVLVVFKDGTSTLLKNLPPSTFVTIDSMDLKGRNPRG